MLGSLLLIRAWMAKIFNTIDIEKAQALLDGQSSNDGSFESRELVK